MDQSRDSLDALAEEVFELDGLLDYQDGAIVSRTLIDKEAATVTLFAFDSGQRLSEHTAPHDALVQVLDGTVTVTIGDGEHRLTAGESVIFPADVPHSVAAETPMRMLLTMVR